MIFAWLLENNYQTKNSFPNEKEFYTKLKKDYLFARVQ